MLTQTVRAAAAVQYLAARRHLLPVAPSWAWRLRETTAPARLHTARLNVMSTVGYVLEP